MNEELPKLICPKCGKKTLEIHGEGITSEGEHYPLEQCTNCEVECEIYCMQNHHLMFEGDKFESIEEATERLISYFSIDHTKKELRYVKESLIKDKVYAEIEIRNVKDES